MTNRNTTGIIVIFFLLFVDLLIYQYQKANSPKGVIPCYPPGKAYPQKYVPDTIKYVQALKNNYHKKQNRD
jgi:hypothetical protein